MITTTYKYSQQIKLIQMTKINSDLMKMRF